jgi:hypothetical protein
VHRSSFSTPLSFSFDPLDDMEALLAVGLAGNVVQFVQFSGQLISLAKEIKKRGAASSLLDLRKVAQNLTQQTRVIVTRLKANTATLEQEEQVYRQSTVTNHVDKN